MELAEAPFSDPGTMSVIMLVLFTVLGLWLVLVIGGSVAGYRAGRHGTRRAAFVAWVVSVAIQSVVAVGGIAGVGFGLVLWLVPPLLLTVVSHVVGRMRRDPRGPDAQEPGVRYW